MFGHYDYEGDARLRHRLGMMERELNELRIKVAELSDTAHVKTVSSKTIEKLLDQQLKQKVPLELHRSLSSVALSSNQLSNGPLAIPHPPAPASLPPLPPPPPPPPSSSSLAKAIKPSIKAKADSIQSKIGVPLQMQPQLQGISLQTLLSARNRLRSTVELEERDDDDTDNLLSLPSSSSDRATKALKTSGQQPLVTLSDLSNIQLRARATKKTTRDAPESPFKGRQQAPALNNLRKTLIQRSLSLSFDSIADRSD